MRALPQCLKDILPHLKLILQQVCWHQVWGLSVSGEAGHSTSWAGIQSCLPFQSSFCAHCKLQGCCLLVCTLMFWKLTLPVFESVYRTASPAWQLPGCSPCTDQPQGHVSLEDAARLPDMLDEANCRCLHACFQAAPCSADLQEAAELGIVRCLSQKVTQCSAPCTGPGADPALAAAGFWLGGHAGCTTWGRVHVNG